MTLRVCIVLAIVASASTAMASPASTEEPLAYLVGYEPGQKANVLRGLLDLGLAPPTRSIDALGLLRVTSGGALDATHLLALPGVVFVETDGSTRATGAQWNGAQWNGAQWDGREWTDGMQNESGQWGHPAVRTAAAWELEGGERSADVCVVDSGVDWDHPDLEANAWTADGVHGFNAIDGTSDASDDAGHGTHVAGIAAAVRGNGDGIAGVTTSRVMSAKVLQSDGSGKVSDLALGMVWCADHGAEVALLALSVDGHSRAVRRALDYLEAHDVLVVASAGNGGPCAGCVSYPASDPRVLAVAAVDKGDVPATFSAAGPEVDLAAPGVGIVSTFDGGRYAEGSGTSQAAAWVAGAGALVRESQPNLSATQVRHALLQGARDVGPAGADPATGAGVLDVHQALVAASGGA